MAATMTLPRDEVQRLADLRHTDVDRFRARVRDLHAAGWTYASIALPFLSPRATAQAWERRAPSLEEIPRADDIPVAPVRASGSGAREVFAHMRPEVTDAEAQRLRELHSTVRKIRGWTPQDSPARDDAVELEEMIEAMHLRGVSYASIARAMNVTYRAVAGRMERRAREKAEAGKTDDVVAVA